MPRYNSLLLSFLLLAPSALTLEHPLCAKVCVETALKDTRCAGKPSSECFCKGHENGILRDFYTCMSTIVNPCEGEDSMRMVAGLYKLCPKFAPATVAYSGSTFSGTQITSFIESKLKEPWTSISYGLSAPTTITSGTSTIVVLPASATPTPNPTGVVVIDGKTVVNGTTLGASSSTGLTTITGSSSPAPTPAPTASTAAGNGTVIITSTAANGTIYTSTQIAGPSSNGTLTTISPSSNGTTTEPTSTSSSTSTTSTPTNQVLSPITPAKPNLPVQKQSGAAGLAVGGSSFGLAAAVVLAAFVL